MSALEIILFALAILAIVVGLVMSRHGAGSGIAALSGQETELFRKSKDRGFIKQMHRTMLAVGTLLIVIGIMLVANIDMFVVLGVAIAIFVVLTTATILGSTNDRKMSGLKSAVGAVFGAGIGLFTYMLAVDTNRKNVVNAND